MIFRDHMIHVVPRLRLGGVYSMLQGMVRIFPGYQHTVLHETPLCELDADTVVYAQGIGLDLLQVDQVDGRMLRDLEGTVAVLYNTDAPHHKDLGRFIPSVYYNYGTHNPEVGSTAYVACSRYAAQRDRYGTLLGTVPEYTVIPPLVNTRELRRLTGGRRPFTVGILASTQYDKYPVELAKYLIGALPTDCDIVINTAPWIDAAMGDIPARANGRRARLSRGRMHPSGRVHYLAKLDVLVCATEPGYYEPYNALLTEAMAAGKAVVVENQGAPPMRLTHKKNAIIFDGPYDALTRILQLKENPTARAQLGANAQLAASWEDLTVHADVFKSIVRGL